jgi:cell division protein FtsL
MRFFFMVAIVVGALTLAGLRIVHDRNQAVAFELSKALNERQRIDEDLRQRRIDRAALLDPKRLIPLAKERGLRVPAPDAVVVLREVPDGP